MAKLSAHGRELRRFFFQRRLTALMEDGTRLTRTPFSGWKVSGRKKIDVPMEMWLKHWDEIISELPQWQQKCRQIPSFEALQRWSFEGIAETPTGYRVEPDGHGPDGSPSWLLVFGLI